MNNANTARRYRRGEIYYADLNPVMSHEHGGIRPVLVLQNDANNRSTSTLIVTQATHRISKKPTMKNHVVLEDIKGLTPTLFMLEQIRTIDNRRIIHFVGRLTKEQMSEIDSALHIALQLSEDDFLPLKSRDSVIDRIRWKLYGVEISVLISTPIARASYGVRKSVP